ncbi:MAG: hypothetical protein KDK39_05775 [Leptospiraceae bacterium]|nr:hypothetical protein [Leptospiraceae bacterium]
MAHTVHQSPVVHRSSDLIADMAISLPDLLTPGLFLEYADACKAHLSAPGESVVLDAITQFAIQCLVLQLTVFFHDRRVFHFGLELQGESILEPDFNPDSLASHQAPLEPELPPGCNLVRRWVWHQDQLLMVHMVCLKPLRRMCANLLDYELLPMIQNWFLEQPQYSQQQFIDHNRILHRILQDLIVPQLGSGVPVTLSYFRFQQLTTYLEAAGEKQSGELLQELLHLFHRNLKQSDTVVQITPIHYLVVSPGATTHIMRERFKHIFFTIKSLVLEYKLEIHTIQDLPVRMNDIWKNLNIGKSAATMAGSQ